jgi:hypothetical protein
VIHVIHPDRRLPTRDPAEPVRLRGVCEVIGRLHDAEPLDHLLMRT